MQTNNKSTAEKSFDSHKGAGNLSSTGDSVDDNSSFVSIYIHWPFCVSKCPYCDFNSHVLRDIDQKKWLQAYKNELNTIKEITSYKNIKSIFFGGGTPSLMPPELMDGVISHIADLWGFDHSATEISMEANPNSIEIKKLKDFKVAGINRLSLGIQSFVRTELEFLGRAHSKEEALRALKSAADIFDNYSFDLIYARPGQSVEQWEEELNEALDYIRYHLSLYQLTIEPNTAFASYYRQGKFELPDDDTAIRLYEKTAEVLAKRGISAYEISNYAKPGYECRHNLSYWRYKDYIGIGPGAHGRISLKDYGDGDKDIATKGKNEARAVFSTRCHRAPEVWLERALSSSPDNFSIERVGVDDAIKEKMLMNLRLIDGMSLREVEHEFCVDIWDHINKERVEHLVAEELLMLDDDSYSYTLKLTPKGIQKLDAILRYIIE